ncbi:zinc-binding dehydrogenase [Rhodococcus jostii]|uniref:zinc-binding dehydrogenase n=1 Tax=Rhodococcus jostii TaxID=132919 RepID=UPI003639AB01
MGCHPGLFGSDRLQRGGQDTSPGTGRARRPVRRGRTRPHRRRVAPCPRPPQHLRGRRRRGEPLPGPGHGRVEHRPCRARQRAKDIRRAVGGPASAVVDFVNNGVTATSAFEVLTKAGHMVQVGLFGGEITIPTALLALRMIHIEGSFVGTLAQLQELVRIAQGGMLPNIPVVERALSAAEVSRALDDLTAGGIAGRIVLTA